MPYLTGSDEPKPDDLLISVSGPPPPYLQHPTEPSQSPHERESHSPAYPSWTGLIQYPESFTRSPGQRELPDPRRTAHRHGHSKRSHSFHPQLCGTDDPLYLRPGCLWKIPGSPQVDYTPFYVHEQSRLGTKAGRQSDSVSSDYQPVSSPDSSGSLTEYTTDDFSDYEYDLEETELVGSSPAFTDQSDADQNIKCEFAEICQMGADGEKTHYRKIISHIFGRNKSATKVFPEEVWVHYCRKHYQRARYRAGEWPFTQCNLLEESLVRMEKWGGVESFQLILRRREQERIHHTDDQDNNDANPGQASHASARSSSKSTSSGKSRQAGRRNPRAVIAPVPDWLRERTGSGLNFEDIGDIIREIRQYLKERRGVETKEPGKVDLPSKAKKGHRASSKRPPTRTPISSIRFPDIEIIPTFRKWALEDYERRYKLRKQEDKKGKGKEIEKKKPSPNVSGGRSNTGFTTRARSSRRVMRDISRSPSVADIGRSQKARQSVGRINSRGAVKKPLKRSSK
ncbi:hypothetical protein VI817_007287 [Penicillium citrinum]|nr:hypothetical protein VI817_007287 [Penicillium citrinum]